MNSNRSIETIKSPEFIDIEPFNPLVSKCQIKVLYVGKNRNGSFIDKDTAVKMAATLPSSPIVGVFYDDKGDFGDHGDVMTVRNGEVEFTCETRPYGFVAPDAKVWFQTFVDTDPFGNETEREYLMTEGYLWTGQYEEAQSVIESGKGQSMELDGDTLEGRWATDPKTGFDFFIINDAVFSKLCILGDDVEPCFEGASIVAAPTDYSANYTDFKNTLFNMMNELKFALAKDERGSEMPDEKIEVEEEQVQEEFSIIEDGAFEDEENLPEDDDVLCEDIDGLVMDDDVDVEFAKSEDACEEEEPEDEEEECDEFAMTKLVSEVEALRAENEAFKLELAELREFKLQVERSEKDALIDKYFMLSDEDKADVVSNRDAYSLDEIEAKLALAYVKKNVSFDIDEIEAPAEEPVLAFSLDDDASDCGDFAMDSIHEALRSFRNDML